MTLECFSKKFKMLLEISYNNNKDYFKQNKTKIAFHDEYTQFDCPSDRHKDVSNARKLNLVVNVMLKHLKDDEKYNNIYFHQVIPGDSTGDTVNDLFNDYLLKIRKKCW